MQFVAIVLSILPILSQFVHAGSFFQRPLSIEIALLIASRSSPMIVRVVLVLRREGGYVILPTDSVAIYAMPLFQHSLRTKAACSVAWHFHCRLT